MTPIERQILKNQSTILTSLSPMVKDLDNLNSINERVKETLEFFVDKNKEDCCDMDKEVCEHDWEKYCSQGGCSEPKCNHKGRLCRKCKIDFLDAITKRRKAENER